MGKCYNTAMHIFGGNWEGHLEKIKKDWRAQVTDDDVVLISGDISWAMKLSDALVDLQSLADLPGKKVFIRGNHDYWWNGITKLRDSAPDESFIFLQTDSVKIGNFVIVGSRGWTCPGSADYTEQDQKLYLREGQRFRLAFVDAEKLAEEGDKKIALIHYPPFNLKKEPTLFTEIFEQNGVDIPQTIVTQTFTTTEDTLTHRTFVTLDAGDVLTLSALASNNTTFITSDDVNTYLTVKQLTA